MFTDAVPAFGGALPVNPSSSGPTAAGAAAAPSQNMSAPIPAPRNISLAGPRHRQLQAGAAGAGAAVATFAAITAKHATCSTEGFDDIATVSDCGE